jgi:hypothetical protein
MSSAADSCYSAALLIHYAVDVASSQPSRDEMIGNDIGQSDDQHDHPRLKQGGRRILRRLDDEDEGAADGCDDEAVSGDRH